MTSEVL